MINHETLFIGVGVGRGGVLFEGPEIYLIWYIYIIYNIRTNIVFEYVIFFL